MGVRQEHIQGVLMRLSDQQRISRYLTLECIREKVPLYFPEEDATKIRAITTDLILDRGKHTLEELRKAVDELPSEKKGGPLSDEKAVLKQLVASAWVFQKPR